MLQPGVIVGHQYRIVRALGRGGMGEVYEAVHEPLSRRVAIKTILPELAASKTLFARFRREAESAAALGHPNIVQVTDFQDLPGEPPLLVMELLEGVTLRQVLDRETKIDPRRAAFIAMQVLSGLAAAHRAGIVHRDIKPGNIFLMSTLAMNDLAKVVDFGIAKLVEEAAVETAQAKITAFGQVLGTLAYMAPEQASGMPVDHRADLYALGATLYHAVSGVVPVEGYGVAGSGRPPLAEVAPWVDSRFVAIIQRSLLRAPEARWSSAEEMAAAIAPFADTGARLSGQVSGHVSGVDPSVAARLAAPTGGGTGASMLGGPHSPTPMGAPMAYGSAPAGYGPPPAHAGYGPPPAPPGLAMAAYGAPAPLPMPAPRSSPAKWIIPLVVGLVVVVTVLPMIFSYAMVYRASSPSAIQAQTEKSFLQNAPLAACPAPEQCTETHSDHGVSFPICTKTIPLALSPLKPGDFVVARRDGKSTLASVQQPFDKGTASVTWLTGGSGGSQAEISEDDFVGRLCGVNAKRVR